MEKPSPSILMFSGPRAAGGSWPREPATPSPQARRPARPTPPPAPAAKRRDQRANRSWQRLQGKGLDRPQRVSFDSKLDRMAEQTGNRSRGGGKGEGPCFRARSRRQSTLIGRKMDQSPPVPSTVTQLGHRSQIARCTRWHRGLAYWRIGNARPGGRGGLERFAKAEALCRESCSLAAGILHEAIPVPSRQARVIWQERRPRGFRARGVGGRQVQKTAKSPRKRAFLQHDVLPWRRGRPFACGEAMAAGRRAARVAVGKTKRSNSAARADFIKFAARVDRSLLQSHAAWKQRQAGLPAPVKVDNPCMDLLTYLPEKILIWLSWHELRQWESVAMAVRTVNSRRRTSCLRAGTGSLPRFVPSPVTTGRQRHPGYGFATASRSTLSR